MHTDEAIQAWRLGNLIEGEGFEYLPDDGHGPGLLFLTLPVLWIKSIDDYVGLEEKIIRTAPAIYGSLLIILMLLFKRLIKIPGIAAAAILMALSPMHVYYSRYYIMEIPMLALLALFIFFSWKYLENQKLRWMIGAGFICGLMHATKETFIISIAALVISSTAVFILEEINKRTTARLKLKNLIKNFCIGFTFMILASASLYSIFFDNLSAIKESYTSYLNYLSRAEGSGHEKPFFYYLKLIAWNKMELYTWNEMATLILAVAGVIFSFLKNNTPTKQTIFLRVLSLYTIITLLIYSIIPYKTPWSILPFLQGSIILAGFGFTSIYELSNRSIKWRSLSRIALVAISIGVILNLYTQNQNALKFPANPDRNPYVYGHTSPSLVSKLVKQVEELKEIKNNLTIKVFHPETGWPLPYYFREIENSGYYPHVVGDVSSDIIISDAAYDDDITKKIGDNYIGPDLMNLRDNVMLHLYIEKELFFQLVNKRSVQN
jgi:uncharacterized protein (TIGR03663 family)